MQVLEMRQHRMRAGDTCAQCRRAGIIDVQAFVHGCSGACICVR